MATVDFHWVELVSQRLGWTLIHFLWQGAIVAMILAVLMHLLKRSTAQSRYCGAGLALCVMVVLPIVTFSGMNEPTPASQTPAQVQSIAAPKTQSGLPPVALPTQSNPVFSPSVTVEHADLTEVGSWPHEARSILEPSLPWLVVLWLTGVAGMSIWHAGAWVRLLHLRLHVTERIDAPVRTTFAQLRRRMGIRQAVRLCESARVYVPMVMGWLKPMVLLPVSGLSGLSGVQIEAILAHELAHVRRHDYLVNLLQTAVEILGFYHPAVWWVSHRMRIERELCCDDIAVQATGRPLAYAQALAHLEAGRTQSGVLALAATDGPLTQRIKRLVQGPIYKSGPIAWVSGLGVLCVVLATLCSVVMIWDGSQAEPSLEIDSEDLTAWTVMRQVNCPPLLLGLTQQFAKVLDPNRQGDPVWQMIDNGASMELTVEVDDALEGEVLIGLFAKATWDSEPVAVRRLPGPGVHKLEGLPEGDYQVAALIGTPAVPLALGVQKQWPAPVSVRAAQGAEVHVLVSEAFQQWASGRNSEAVVASYPRQRRRPGGNRLVQGHLTRSDGEPVRFGWVLVRPFIENRTSRPGISIVPDAEGLYRHAGIGSPYCVYALRHESLPSVLGVRQQRIFFQQPLEGAQTVDFRFPSFPVGDAILKGRVVDQLDQPVEGFFLRIRSGIPEEQTLLSGPADGQFHSAFGITVPFMSKNGFFEMGGLPGGTITADVTPFETGKYERHRGKEVVLRAGQTMDVVFEPKVLRILHGRVLFEDGSPAVVTSSQQRSVRIRILMPMVRRGLAGTLAEADQNGDFTIYLSDAQIEKLQSRSSPLGLYLAGYREGGGQRVGEYPFDLLAKDKANAGVVRIARPEPAVDSPPVLPAPPVYLPAAMRQGRPLPPQWQLDYERRRPNLRGSQVATLQIVSTFTAAAQADAPFVLNLYSLDGMPVESVTLTDRSRSIRLQQSDVFLATLSPEDRSDPSQLDPNSGPFLLVLSEPGRYTLNLINPAILADAPADAATTERDAESPASSRTMEIQVVSPGGQAIVDGEVFVLAQRDARREPGTRILANGRTDEAGTFHFQVRDEWETQVAQASVIVKTDEGHLGFGTILNWELRTEKVVVDNESGPVKLRIIDRAGEPIQGIRMRVASIAGRRQTSVMDSFQFRESPPPMPGLFWHAATDANGRCVIEQIPMGMDIYVDHDDPRFAQVPGRHSARISGPTPGNDEDEVRLLPAGIIRGRVLLPDGTPVPDALVRAFEHYGYRLGGASAEALTDGDGRFQLGRLLPTTYDLKASPRGDMGKEWVTDLRPVSLDEGRVLEDWNLPLIRGALVTGRVANAETGEGLEGRTIAGTSVNSSSPLHQWWGKTDADGNYQMRLPPGPKEVYYGDGQLPRGYLAPKHKSVWLEAREGEQVTIDFPLRRASTADAVFGYVRASSGEPLPFAVVRLVSTWEFPDQVSLRAARTNRVGEFHLDLPESLHLSNGDKTFPWYLYAERGGKISGLIEVRPDDHVDLLMLKEDQLADFKGRVVDESGRPVKGASIQWFHSKLKNDAALKSIALSDAHGRFEFNGLWADQPIRFRATNATYGPAGTLPAVWARPGETVILSDLVLPRGNWNDWNNLGVPSEKAREDTRQ